MNTDSWRLSVTDWWIILVGRKGDGKGANDRINRRKINVVCLRVNVQTELLWVLSSQY